MPSEDRGARLLRGKTGGEAGLEGRWGGWTARGAFGWTGQDMPRLTGLGMGGGRQSRDACTPTAAPCRCVADTDTAL